MSDVVPNSNAHLVVEQGDAAGNLGALDEAGLEVNQVWVGARLGKVEDHVVVGVDCAVHRVTRLYKADCGYVLADDRNLNRVRAGACALGAGNREDLGLRRGECACGNFYGLCLGDGERRRILVRAGGVC